MIENERFMELWNDYLEGDLDESGVEELRKLLAENEDLLQMATDSYQTHRLLGLLAQDSVARQDDFVRETIASLPAKGERFVDRVMQGVQRGSHGRVRLQRSRRGAWRGVWATAAVLALMATAAFYWRAKAESETARVTGLYGSVQWTGDAGQIERSLAVGRSLGGGTLESLAADSWAELAFRDGSQVTLSGRSVLTITSRARKELHLRHGNLSARIAPQPAGRPMLIHTPTAELEVLGTQFNVGAEMSATVLWVNEGKVRVKRLADGSVADVSAGHQVVAAASRLDDFKVAPRPGSVGTWQSDLPHGITYGQWIPATSGLRATPLLWRDCEKKTEDPLLLYLAALSVSRGDGPPVELRAGAKFRIRGRMDRAADVLIGLTTQHLKGGFAGKHHAFCRADSFALEGGEFELDVCVDDFTPEKPYHPKSAIGLVLYDWWCLTINDDAGLVITSAALIPAESDTSRERSVSVRVVGMLPILFGSIAPQGKQDPPVVTPDDWATYNYDVAGWRFNPIEKALSPEKIGQLEVKWRFPPEGSELKVGVVHATPSVVSGCVYFGTATYPAFYKLRPDGQLAWKFDPGARSEQSGTATSRGLAPQHGIYTSALVTGDSVYFGDTGGVMYCLDRETGREKWRVNSKAPPFPGAHHANLVMGSPILADGKVLFGGGAYEHALPLSKNYECCYGRGFVVALDPQSGALAWKYDVGPQPQPFDPPFVIEDEYGKHVFRFGPSTSSVWSTPSWDERANVVFFGTDVHNSPRKPTDDNPRTYTRHSAAIIALSSTDGSEKWVTQLAAGDVWNHTMSPYEKKTGQYKDRSVGDTPKLYSIDIDGQPTPVVGVGCKNGGYYVLRRDSGEIIANTPVFADPPTRNPKVDPRTLALPSPIGGLQTGCATDGKRVYTNGIDKLPNPDYQQWWKPNPPSGGRVTAISLDTQTEHWRHERPKIAWIGGTAEKPLFRDCGDPIASGIALANGLLFCTTFSSNKLLAIDATTGELLREIHIGPVLSGPSVSRGRVYVGTGNTMFIPGDAEAYFPKKYTGEVISFGLSGTDEIDRIAIK